MPSLLVKSPMQCHHATNAGHVLFQLISVEPVKSLDTISAAAALVGAVGAAAASGGVEEVEEQAETTDLPSSTVNELLRPLTLTLTPESQLDSTQPVYMALMDCSLPLSHILDTLTTPTW